MFAIVGLNFCVHFNFANCPTRKISEMFMLYSTLTWCVYVGMAEVISSDDFLGNVTCCNVAG